MDRKVIFRARGDHTGTGVALRLAGRDRSSPDEHRLEGSAPFEEIYAQFYDRVHKLALRITRNRQDAEDVVQECFLRVFVHLGTFCGRSKLSTWISRIAINAALMKIRKRKPGELSLDEVTERRREGGLAEIAETHPAPDRQLLQRERQRILAEGLAQLSPSLSALVDLHYFWELPARECAQILGISLPSAKCRILRARLKLRPILERRFRRPIISFPLGVARKRPFPQPDVKHDLPNSPGNRHYFKSEQFGRAVSRPEQCAFSPLSTRKARGRNSGELEVN